MDAHTVVLKNFINQPYFGENSKCFLKLLVLVCETRAVGLIRRPRPNLKHWGSGTVIPHEIKIWFLFVINLIKIYNIY